MISTSLVLLCALLGAVDSHTEELLPRQVLMRPRYLLAVVSSFLFSVGPPTELSAQNQAQCAAAPSIEGSVWDGEITRSLGTKDTEVYEFLKGGALAYTTRDGRFTEATWGQNGDCIMLDINDGYVKFIGRLTAVDLRGEFVDRRGDKSTLVATRRRSGGDAAAGREWESLRSQYRAEHGRGRITDAVKTAERALEAAERAFGATDDRLFLTLNELGLMLQSTGKYADALPHAQRALGIAEKSQGRESRQFCSALNTMGRSYTGLRKYVEAEDVFRQALASSERLFGPSDPLVATLLVNMGDLLSSQDRYEEAGPFLEQGLKLLDTDKADQVGRSAALNNLALARQKLGRLDEALMLFERSLGVMERLAGEDHKVLLPILKNLSRLYKENGWVDEAAETEARIRRIQSRST